MLLNDPRNTSDVQVYSYTHSGLTYLINILLELDICIYGGKGLGDFNAYWTVHNNGIYQLNENEDIIEHKAWFPRFQVTKEFRFRHPLRVGWCHEFPRISDFDKPTILMIRDPRDVMASVAARVAPNDIMKFLQNPRTRRIPNYFPLCPTEQWSLYNCLISKLIPAEKLCVVRFEDIKENPYQEVIRILQFLGLNIEPALIMTAIENSSHDNIKKVAAGTTFNEATLEYFSRGHSGAWENIITDKEKVYFYGLPNYVMQSFGYNLNSSEDADHTAINGLNIGKGLRLAESSILSSENFNLLETEKFLIQKSKNIDDNIQQIITLGKFLACCMWTRDLYGEDAIHHPNALKTLRILLQLSQYMLDRPLILITAARGLIDGGNLNAGRDLLQYVASQKDLNFYELFEAGLCCLTSLKDEKLAMKFFAKAPCRVEIKDPVLRANFKNYLKTYDIYTGEFMDGSIQQIQLASRILATLDYRGVFDAVDYRDNQLIVVGWMLVPEIEFDLFKVYIDDQYICDTPVQTREDVSKAKPSIKHAGHSGFSVSIKIDDNRIAMRDLFVISIIGMSCGKMVATMDTLFFKGCSC